MRLIAYLKQHALELTWKRLLVAIIALPVMSANASANLLLNPGFEFPEVPDGMFLVPGADDWQTFNTAGVTESQARPGSSGDQSLRLAPNAPTGNGTGIARQVFSASANDVFSFSGWVMHPDTAPITGPRTGQLRLQWLNANDTLINQVILNVIDETTPTDQWVFVELENYQLPDNPNITTVRPSLFVTNNGGTGGGAAYFDDISLLAATLIDGDFDNNGMYECADVDALVADIAAGTNTAATFDLTGDNDVDTDDLTAWLAEAGDIGGLTTQGGPVLLGDANLDGTVNGADFDVWNANKFTSTAAWCSGDFNADGLVNGGDFLMWNANKFTTADASVVPEPAPIFQLVIVPCLAIALRSRNRP